MIQLHRQTLKGSSRQAATGLPKSRLANGPLIGNFMPNDVLTFIMAGGRGTRLEPLTSQDAKPAIPFGGPYRIIDFTLSNCINSGLSSIFVLTQFKSMSLERHINCTWRSLVNCRRGEFIESLPPQQRMNNEWYRGNADAVYQNIFAIEKENPKYIVVLAGDHVYKMDYREMLNFHISNNATATVGGIPVHVEEAAGQFGVMQIDADAQILDFKEKPRIPKHLPDEPSMCLASMGIYIFDAGYLLDQLCKSALSDGTKHDFGQDVIPASIKAGGAYAYEFRDRVNGQPSYWRDVGTLDAYYDANMDLLSETSPIQLSDQDWPLWRAPSQLPPATVRSSIASDGPNEFEINRHRNIVSDGCVIKGSVNHSILGPGCIIEDGAIVQGCVLLDGAYVEAGAQLQNSIVMPRVSVSGHLRVGPSFREARDFGPTSKRGIISTPRGRHILTQAMSLSSTTKPPSKSTPERGTLDLVAELIES